MTIKEEYKIIENRLIEETQKYDKQFAYRKEIEEKVFR